MNMPGLLIEYLVVGSTALLWLFPLFGIPFESKEAVSIAKAAALAPALYVLGMLVDFVAFLLVSYVPHKKCSLKAFVRGRIYRRHADKGDRLPSPETGKGRHAKITLILQQHTPKLFKEVELRSSRDRIARCAVVNLLLTFVVVASHTSRMDLAALCAFCVPVALGMWMHFERSTSEFELLSYFEALDTKGIVKKTEDRH